MLCFGVSRPFSPDLSGARKFPEVPVTGRRNVAGQGFWVWCLSSEKDLDPPKLHNSASNHRT